MRLLLLLSTAFTAALVHAGAQTYAGATGSIAGVVRDAATGEPMPNVDVFANRGTKDGPKAVTDAQGRYKLTGIPAGDHRVSAYSRSQGGLGPFALLRVSMAAGQDLESIDFRLRTFGSIKGRIVDENKEPLPGITVFLVTREYSWGELRYVFTGVAQSDDRGEYTLGRVEPGRGYLVFAQHRTMRLPAVADSPANPEARKRVYLSTYYPDTPTAEGGQVLVLQPGEQREAVDIRLRRSNNLCISGTANAGAWFSIRTLLPNSGYAGAGGTFMASPAGQVSPEGKFRICGLHPGDYELAVNQQESGPLSYAATSVSISDRDVETTLAPKAALPVPGAIVWAGDPPDPPVSAKLLLLLNPLTRAPFNGEARDAESAVPGQFSFANILVDRYFLDVRRLPENAYLKDITYGGNSIHRQPLDVGASIGAAELRVTLARDGGTLKASVTGKDGVPVPNSSVVLMPIAAPSEAAFAAVLTNGQTNQNGAWTSGMLAPGKYLVLATDALVNNSPESIGRLWRARTRAQEIEVEPNRTVDLALKLTPID